MTPAMLLMGSHHHFFFADSGRLLDIPGEHVAVIRRVDVIIRVDRDPAPATD
jgi:hypothetical protein